MLEKNHESDHYTKAMLEMESGNVLGGLEMLDQILLRDYNGIKPLLNYNAIKCKMLPELVDDKCVHKGVGINEISGNLLRLAVAGNLETESIYEYDLDAVEDGIVIDVVMKRIGGGEENCLLYVDTNIGSELIRFNQHTVHISSNHTKAEIDFNQFHSFRLILEKKTSALIMDGKLSLISNITESKNQNKLVFGCSKGLTNADSENLWSTVRIGTGKNLLSKLLTTKQDDLFFKQASDFYRQKKNAASVYELTKLLMLNPKHVAAKQLLCSIIDHVQVRDPAIYSIDELLVYIDDSELAQYWNKKKNGITTNKVIEVQNVSVKFLRSMQSGTITSLLSSFSSSKKNIEKYFWAIKDISFSVSHGEIVGIIGRNGSGKSTLLRVIANILSPDIGTATISGKPILLAPGMVFREELSGRDNIYLGCLFMGMKKREIENQIDEIIDFAELRSDIDRTFKYYSDGMKSRLNFSVATHLSHDVLLLDELLSAGDASFNRKAAKRMEQLVTESKTTVIVTHATEFVREHCTKTVYLDKGHMKYFGDPDRAVDMYILDTKNY